MVVVPFPAPDDVDRLIRMAIHSRRLLSFDLNGLPRRAEPHDYGIVDGIPKLFFYQVGGRSSSGRPLGWRWAIVAQMRDVRILDERFDGPREAGTARHMKWDRLLASVSRAV